MEHAILKSYTFPLALPHPQVPRRASTLHKHSEKPLQWRERNKMFEQESVPSLCNLIWHGARVAQSVTCN